MVARREGLAYVCSYSYTASCFSPCGVVPSQTKGALYADASRPNAVSDVRCPRQPRMDGFLSRERECVATWPGFLPPAGLRDCPQGMAAIDSAGRCRCPVQP